MYIPSQVPAFAKCTPDMICELVSRSVRQYAFPGQWIVRQGDPGIGLFMITRGVVEVSQKKEVDASTNSGDGDGSGAGAAASSFPRREPERATLGSWGAVLRHHTTAVSSEATDAADAARAAADAVGMVLGRNEFFGERSILTNEVETHSVKALGLVELMVLHRKELHEVFELFPELRDVLRAHRSTCKRSSPKRGPARLAT